MLLLLLLLTTTTTISITDSIDTDFLLIILRALLNRRPDLKVVLMSATVDAERFSQYLDPGRQTEKYIKFGADDLENYIDELFDGNPSSMARRRM